MTRERWLILLRVPGHTFRAFVTIVGLADRNGNLSFTKCVLAGILYTYIRGKGVSVPADVALVLVAGAMGKSMFEKLLGSGVMKTVTNAAASIGAMFNRSETKSTSESHSTSDVREVQEYIVSEHVDPETMVDRSEMVDES
jgi:hypothetical protein